MPSAEYCGTDALMMPSSDSLNSMCVALFGRRMFMKPSRDEVALNVMVGVVRVMTPLVGLLFCASELPGCGPCILTSGRQLAPARIQRRGLYAISGSNRGAAHCRRLEFTGAEPPCGTNIEVCLPIATHFILATPATIPRSTSPTRVSEKSTARPAGFGESRKPPALARSAT